MSDRESPEGGPPRKKWLKQWQTESHTPEGQGSHEIQSVVQDVQQQDVPLDQRAVKTPAQVIYEDISPEGGPPRKKLAVSHTPEEVRSRERSSEPIPEVSTQNIEEIAETPPHQSDVEPEEIPETQLDVQEVPETQPHKLRSKPQPSTSGQGSRGLSSRVSDYYFSKFDVLKDVDEQDFINLFNKKPSYFLTKTLGRGGYGSVHSGSNTMRKSDVAIKIVKDGFGHANQATIKQERYVTDKLIYKSHKNILAFIEVFTESVSSSYYADIKRLYIVSELSTIGDLYKAVQNLNDQGISVWRPVKQTLARYLITGIAEGVSHLKTMKISHSDIKLANILLFENEVKYRINEKSRELEFNKWIPKLCDFGCAQSWKNSDPQGTIMIVSPKCTVHYASPESWGRHPDGSCRQFEGYSSDVFSVGVCLLALLLGAHPFRPPFPVQYPAQNEANRELKKRKYALYSSQMKTDTNYVSHICKQFPYPLRQLLLKALKPNPEQRITIEQFLTDPWITSFKSFESENVASRPVSISPTLKTFKGKDFAKDI